MRILLFSGKGGVGKTSLAAATGLKLAQLKYRTLVMSIDPAHSLADAFDLNTDLFHVQTADPMPINDRLSIQELNIQREITLDWYMKHIFPFQRNLLKAVRPIANRVAPFELPPDAYFGNIRDLFGKLEGVDAIMEDPQITSVRLITNPEKMVLRETQRTFVYFSLHGLTVDAVIVNRVLPT